ncbi:hypothetical protein E2C01_100825 [Portunus trituberculatus]|uniref:Uncharacterized protein n=1 Tax=Portunus trituberculatus TaxID=210409 RepID=A0A5B7KD69_PORTR|nr:hypothetical protein [Portunus trituberculatus]
MLAAANHSSVSYFNMRRENTLDNEGGSLSYHPPPAPMQGGAGRGGKGGRGSEAKPSGRVRAISESG